MITISNVENFLENYKKEENKTKRDFFQKLSNLSIDEILFTFDVLEEKIKQKEIKDLKIEELKKEWKNYLNMNSNGIINNIIIEIINKEKLFN